MTQREHEKSVDRFMEAIEKMIQLRLTGAHYDRVGNETIAYHAAKRLATGELLDLTSPFDVTIRDGLATNPERE